VGEHADVAGAVADHREGLFIDGGEDELALFAVRQHFAGIGVDDLGDELILADVHAALLAAFIADAGALELREAVNVVCFDPELLLNVMTHLFAPGLRAEYSRLELYRILQPLFDDRLAQIGGV